MDRIATEIAQEIGVFFQDNDVDTHAREQKSQYHPGRTASRDAATRLDYNRHVNLCRSRLLDSTASGGNGMVHLPAQGNYNIADSR